MSEPNSQTANLQHCLDRLASGDANARVQLLALASDRLTRLARSMLRDFPALQRWEQTDDVLQNAVLRLDRALRETIPGDVRGFLALAALQIRRELIDLTRHYFGPHGAGTHHDSAMAALSTSGNGRDWSETTMDPTRLSRWREFHEQIDILPADEREAFDLLWYQGLPQSEAAALLGVSERTLQRRWHAARVHLHEALHGELPGI